MLLQNQHQYFVEYIEKARKNASALPQPDPERANGTYDYLNMLYESRDKGQAAISRLIEAIEKHRPELAKFLGIPAVDVLEHSPVADLVFTLKCLEREEAGDAEMLVSLYNDRLTYDHQQKHWYYWAGNHWKLDGTNLVRRLVRGQVAAQYHFAAAELDKQIAAESDKDRKGALENQRTIVLNRPKQLYRLNRIKNVLELAQDLMPTPSLPGGESSWDSNPWLLGVKNGVINLKTGELRRGHPSDWIRKATPTKWEGLDTKAKRFEQFINEIFDNAQDMTGFIQRLFGYGITGLSTEHILPIFYGEEGRNGKDTLLETIGAVLGKELAGAGAPDLITERGWGDNGGPSPHLIDLHGARLKWVSETNESARMNTNQIKYITGGSTIKGRGLHRDYTEFQSTHLLILMTNHRPQIPSGGDPALWERLLLVPFNMRFVEEPKQANDRKRDAYLKDKFKAETSGILAWLVRGCLAFQQQGLKPPVSVRAATEAYRKGENLLEQFLNDCCAIGEQHTISAIEIYDAFKEWGGTWSKRKFGDQLTKLYAKKRTTGGRMVYLGVGMPESEHLAAKVSI